VSYANGAIFQTRFLLRALTEAGHHVSIVGPRDPNSAPGDMAQDTIQLPSVPIHCYPGLRMPLPLARWIFDPDRWDYDLVFAQTTSLLLELGVWLRRVKGIPLIAVNTTHVPAAYHVLLPTWLSKHPAVHGALRWALLRPCERLFTSIYNGGDGLVVLSDGLAAYWRENGVTVPIHVIPRAVSPGFFDNPPEADPYNSPPGTRLLCAGRFVREKAQARVIQTFAEHILPRVPGATLTLVGDGPTGRDLQRLAAKLGVADRVIFAGEQPFLRMHSYYHYADLFLHCSLSETFGNVLGEALWCGLPAVAFADGMGASYQVRDGWNGVLVPVDDDADRRFGDAVVELLGDERKRKELGAHAASLARQRSSPEAVTASLAEAFVSTYEHAKRSPQQPTGRFAAFGHFRRWLMGNGAVWIAGHFSPGHGRGQSPRQPQLGG
jgi:glycosyltransferase involved in cell wall biosynthesis